MLEILYQPRFNETPAVGQSVERKLPRKQMSILLELLVRLPLRGRHPCRGRTLPKPADHKAPLARLLPADLTVRALKPPNGFLVQLCR